MGPVSVVMLLELAKGMAQPVCSFQIRELDSVRCERPLKDHDLVAQDRILVPLSRSHTGSSRMANV